MKKYLFIIAILLLTIQISSGQDSTVYVAKARLFGHIGRYNCAKLILRSDTTYHFEEIAGDLLMDIAEGKYELRSDTIYLFRTDEFPTIKYIKKRNRLISLQEYTLGRKLKKNGH